MRIKFKFILKLGACLLVLMLCIRLHTFAANDELVQNIHDFKTRIDTSEKVILYNADTSDSKVLTLVDGVFNVEENGTKVTYDWLLLDGENIFRYSSPGQLWFSYNHLSSISAVKLYIISGTSEGRYYVYQDNILNFDDDSVYCSVEDIDYNIAGFDNEYTYISAYFMNESKEEHEIVDAFYFNNLDINFGENVDGSCQYVAAGTIFSYYDILYNDKVIVDEGVNIDNYTNPFIISSFVNNSFDISDCESSPGYSEEFHQFLIHKCGYEMEDDSYGIIDSKAVTMINKYIDTYSNLKDSSAQATLRYNVSSNSIISEISDGNPQIITFSEGCIYFKMNSNGNYSAFVDSSMAHSLIVYGYRIMSNGDIYYKCHSGWKNSPVIYIKPFDNINMIKVNIPKENGNNFDSTNDNHNAYIYKHSEAGIDCNGIKLCKNRKSYPYYLNSSETCTMRYYSCPECSKVLYTNEINNHICNWSSNIYTHSGVCINCNEKINDSHTYFYNPKMGLYKCAICGFTTQFIPQPFSLVNEVWVCKESLLNSSDYYENLSISKEML